MGTLLFERFFGHFLQQFEFAYIFGMVGKGVKTMVKTTTLNY